MVDEKTMSIMTTFTYDKATDVIGWKYPNQHRKIRPTIHKGKKVGWMKYEDYCTGRGGKKYSVKLIKKVLGGKDE